MQPHPAKANWIVIALQAAVLALAAWFVYSPAAQGGWIWDDPVEVQQNPALRDPAGLARIWTGSAGVDYLPVKTTVQWLAWRLWGEHTAGYHWLNIGLHLLSGFLFWRLLKKLGVSAFGAWFGGLLFVVHPLAVESVAWISELKNVLSLALLLLAMNFWIEFDRWSELPPTRSFDSAKERPLTILPNEARSGQHAPPFYVLSFACFVAAMLSKSSVVMFPVILLLHAWWKRGRVTQKDLIASAPFFAVSLVLGLVAIWFQHHRAIAGVPLDLSEIGSRFAGAGLAIAFYFWKCIWPVGLMPIYPRWALDPPSLWQYWPWLAVAIATIFICRWSGLPPTRSFGSAEGTPPTILPNEARSGQPAPPAMARHLLFGLGFFLINLLPALGFVPMSYLRISWVSDHFAYISLLGIVGLAAAAISKFEFRNPKFGSVVAAALIAALAVQAHSYAAVFRDEKTLWTYALEHNPNAWMAHNNLGKALFIEGKLAEAGGHFERAKALYGDDAEVHFNLGLVLADAGRQDAAMAEYQAALRLRPAFPEAQNCLGNALLHLGRPAEAVGFYQAALRLKPDYPEAHANLGVALAELGQSSEAEEQFEAALRLNPGYPEAEQNLKRLREASQGSAR